MHDIHSHFFQIHQASLRLRFIIGLFPGYGRRRTITPSRLAERPRGEGTGQIAPVVLERARALYLARVAEGKVSNACYFAMDATRPNDRTDGTSGGRFYVICEAQRSFRVISAGHGGGRNLAGTVNFSNGRECAKNFGNALDSNLTAGGAYMTSEIKTTFKGYYRTSANQESFLTRSFVQFDGTGETANARQRAIGGHAAALVSGICMLKKPDSTYANRDGYVPRGNLVTYPAGRSDGCTSWSPDDAPQVLSLVKDNPTTLYIYPESRDINAVSRDLTASRSTSGNKTYWNNACLKEIGSRSSGLRKSSSRLSLNTSRIIPRLHPVQSRSATCRLIDCRLSPTIG